MFEDMRHESSLLLLLSIKISDKMKQSKTTEFEINIKKGSCSRKITLTENIERVCCCIYKK